MLVVVLGLADPSGVEHTREVLAGLGIEFESYSPEMRELTVFYTGEMLKRHFETYMDGQGKNFNPDKPIIPAVFWGDQIVGKAFKASRDKEGELIRKHGVDAMKLMGENHMGKTIASFTRQISPVEKK